MRIWYVTMFFPAPRETFAANDIKALIRAGLEVSVHSLRAPYPEAERLRSEYGVEDIQATAPTPASWLRGLLVALRNPRVGWKGLVFVLKHGSRSITHLAKGLALLPRALELYDRAANERPDVVHVFWGHYPSLLGYLIKTQLGIPTTTFLGTYDFLAGYPGGVALAKTADAVFTHAHANVADLIAAGVPSERVVVAHRGVHPDLLHAPTGEKRLHRIVSAGALELPKRMDVVLDVFALVQKRWPDAQLVICGDGPQRASLEEQARALGLRHVEFRGYVSHQAVFSEMQQAEVFLFLSCADYERLPNVIKEAIAARCYCVLGTTVGVEELVPGREYGCVVAEGAWDEAARAVDAAFSDPVARTSATERARGHLLAAFDVDVTMSTYRRVWASLLPGD